MFNKGKLISLHLRILVSASVLTLFYSSAFADQEQIAQGHYFTQLAGCSNCHSQAGGEPFAGGAGIETAGGTVFAPNITMSENFGIGKWTDADFIRALRKGVSPTGRHYFPVFPFQSFTQLTDQDILAIKAYLGTIPKVERKNHPSDLGFFAGIAVNNGIWSGTDPMGKPRDAKIYERNFFVYAGPFQPFQRMDEAWNRGAYLIEGPLHCTQCHTPRDGEGHLKLASWMGGANSKQMVTPNITPDPSSFVAGWTADQWDHFLSTGEDPAGSSASAEMAEVVQTQTSALTAQDRAAVVRYLMALWPVH